MHIHFMGIGGSGMSAVAQIAASQGYTVSGCDLQLETPYLDHLKSNPDIKIYQGHSPDHLNGVDLLCITPAALYQNVDHPELSQAKNKMTWEEFLGNYLHKDKYLICIAGTHGKSTTTAMCGLLLETAGLDPTVEVGATVKAWQNNVRLPVGNSKYFISEADEFHDNFSSYHPDIILLTLIELDHPEYFGTVDNMLHSYQEFINHLKPGGRVIANSDSPLLHRLKLPENTVYYSLKNVQNTKQEINHTSFTYSGYNFQLAIPGLHNISNSLGLIELAKILDIPLSLTATVLGSFTGLARRAELLGTINGVSVFDDYANHPSSYAATLSAVRQVRPDGKLLAVIEPHTFSRLRALLPDLPASLKLADSIIISKIFASRETDPGDFSGQQISDYLSAQGLNSQYIPEFPGIVSYIANHKSYFSSIVVMGSGNSYKLSRQILDFISK